MARLHRYQGHPEETRSNSTWSYLLDDENISPAFLPLLSSTNRDANALWGSDFPTPPGMWSEGSGYWGIGRNLTGREQFSTRNGTRWAPSEVLLHPKGGASPASRKPTFFSRSKCWRRRPKNTILRRRIGSSCWHGKTRNGWTVKRSTQ